MSRERIRTPFVYRTEDFARRGRPGTPKVALGKMFQDMRASHFLHDARGSMNPQNRGMRIAPNLMRQYKERRTMRMRRWTNIADRVRKILWSRVKGMRNL